MKEFFAALLRQKKQNKNCIAFEPQEKNGIAFDQTERAKKINDKEIDILARTIWGEARGEGNVGMEAVANVIMNRVKKGGWWGNSINEVCLKPYQFSCWNQNDANFKKLKNISDENLYFVTALRIARRAVMGLLEDKTSGADHYHAAGISPKWSRGKKPSCVIGKHIFYNLKP